MKKKILVITPVKHIMRVTENLEAIAAVTYMDDPTLEEILPLIKSYDAIFTNPNKSKIFIGKELIDAGKKLKVICTASTGTNHIDKDYAKAKNIKVLSLTEERKIINKISSTAEHAFALTMSSLRNITQSYMSVLEGQWDYENFIGRQMDGLTIGIIGFGRLGSIYSKYCNSFNSKVLAFDPYKTILDDKVQQVDSINKLLIESDVISIHAHVNAETTGMVNESWFEKMKKNVLLINTSRGEIINEDDLVKFLSKNKLAKVATDVLSDEIRNREMSKLLNYAKKTDQVIITPHIGGMTKEAQEIAYNHAARLLKQYYNKH